MDWLEVFYFWLIHVRFISGWNYSDSYWSGWRSNGKCLLGTLLFGAWDNGEWVHNSGRQFIQHLFFVLIRRKSDSTIAYGRLRTNCYRYLICFSFQLVSVAITWLLCGQRKFLTIAFAVFLLCMNNILFWFLILPLIWTKIMFWCFFYKMILLFAVCISVILSG